MIQGVNSTFEIKKDVEKLENRYEKFFIIQQKMFTEEKPSNEQRNLKLQAISLMKS